MKEKLMNKIYVVLLSSIFALVSLPVFAQKDVISNIMPASNTSVLFIQIANQGQFIPKPGQYNTYTLKLKKVDPFTSYFTDRPKRITGILPTNQFVNLWHTKDIKTTPPNVALETSNIQNGKRINRILVLSDPIYDVKGQEINYTAKILDKNAAPLGNIVLGYTVLFIDDFNWGGNQIG